MSKCLLRSMAVASRSTRRRSTPGCVDVPSAAPGDDGGLGDDGGHGDDGGDGHDAEDLFGALDREVAEEMELDDDVAWYDRLDDEEKAEVDGARVDDEVDEVAASSGGHDGGGGGHGDDGGDGDEDATGGDVEELPFLDEGGRVHNPRNPEETWGRVTILKEGLPGEGLSLYCNRHGCKILKKTSDAPDIRQVLRWFLRGQVVPRGRTPALVHEHKAMWDGCA